MAEGNGGRPTKYNEALGKTICELLADGLTLIDVCKLAEMPNERTVRQWAADPQHPFSPLYARAREIGYQHMADRLLAIADGPGDAQ